MRLALLLLALLFASDASAQLSKEKLPELGLPTFYRPRHFDIIPLQPGEQWKILYMQEKAAEERGRGAERRSLRPDLHVCRVAKLATVSAPEKSEPPKVHSVETLIKYDFRGWEAEYVGPGKKDRTFSTHIYNLDYKENKSRGVQRKGYVYVWETPGYYYVLIGRCAEDDLEEMVKLWKSVGDKMKVAEPVASEWDAKKMERFYRGSKLQHIPYRVKVREAMVDGWKAEDTENYIVVYNTPDQPLVRKVLRDLETIREAYVELFPPSQEISAVSTVRICADQDEYMAYGGMPRSAGYWNSRTEELVLYDAEKQERGKRPDDSDTFIVLYHEAFHQYIHYSTGELPPHSWYNEGYGDFFSGATIKNGKVRKIDVNSWRIRTIQMLIEGELRGAPVPWKDIVSYSQGKYYQNGGMNYAQGWSMIYFLNTAPAVKKNKTWSAILPNYFETLKTVYKAELAELGEDPAPEKKAAAGQKAREAALEAAFADVDMDEIHDAWEEYTMTLKVPGER